MAKTRRPAPTRRKRAPRAAETSDTTAQQVATGGAALHELFAQQAREMLDRADLDEEQKQSILVAMSCPCCGAGGMSFTVKLKR